MLDLLEVEDGHEFMLDTCCQALHKAIPDDMRDDPEYSAEWLHRLGIESVIGAQLRRVAACVEGYHVDCKLEFAPSSKRMPKCSSASITATASSCQAGGTAPGLGTPEC